MRLCFQVSLVVKNPLANAGDVRKAGSIWRRTWPPTPVFLPRESHGQRSLAGYSPWGHKESDTTERISMHTAHTLDLGITHMIHFTLITSLRALS